MNEYSYVYEYHLYYVSKKIIYYLKIVSFFIRKTKL
jgi:hypothetical protein